MKNMKRSALLFCILMIGIAIGIIIGNYEFAFAKELRGTYMYDINTKSEWLSVDTDEERYFFYDPTEQLLGCYSSEGEIVEISDSTFRLVGGDLDNYVIYFHDKEKMVLISLDHERSLSFTKTSSIPTYMVINE